MEAQVEQLSLKIDYRQSLGSNILTTGHHCPVCLVIHRNC